MVVLEPLEWGPSGSGEGKEALIGSTSFSMQTTDITGAIEELRGRGVDIETEPEAAPWGTYALISDLYGNTLHVLEPHPGDAWGFLGVDKNGN